MPTNNKGWMDAAIGAGAAYMSAQQANRPRNQTTNQTTTQTPFGLPLIAPDIESALDYQRQLMAAGPRYVGQTGGGGGGRGGGAAPAAAPAAGRGRASTWTNARGETMTMDASGRAVRAPAGAGGAAPGGGPAAPSAPHGIDQISDAVAQAGLNAGNAPYIQAAQHGVQNILSGQGGANGGGSGFQGYNPINDYLAGQLRGDVEGRDASRLLHDFLGVGAGGGYSDAGGGAGGNGRGVRYSAPTYLGGAGGGGFPTSSPGGGGGGAGSVPDTVGNSSSYFATQLRDLMNSQTNDKDLQTIIDAQNADVLRGMQGDQWALDAQAQGTGRFGGDTWNALANQARADATREMGTNASRARLAEQENRRAMYQNLLGQVNQRDLGAMSDATQRYGIDSSARAAGAGSAEAAAAQRRGQDLQAIMGLMQGDQFNVGALGNLGGQLSSDQLNAIGSAPGLAGIGLGGLGAANNAMGNLVSQQGNANQLRAAQIAAGTARAGMNQQADLYNSQLPQSMANDYFRNLFGIGGMGGVSHTEGQNVQPGMGVSPTAAAAMGGLAGWYGGR